MSNITYGFDDVFIRPARISKVRHRSECDVINEDGMLPLFTAPMNSVVNATNWKNFNLCKINTIIPRGVDINTRLTLATETFVAMSLNEFENFVINTKVSNDIYYICVDIANGHMQALIDLCAIAKEKFNHHLVLMAGNIANPETYTDYAIAGIDFVRCGIGGSTVCTTSINTGVHYGMASLISKVADLKYTIEKCIEDANRLQIPCKYKSVPFIIADGGMDSYSRIIKALALGADFVMCGKVFAQSNEACGDSFWQYPNLDLLTNEDKSRLQYNENEYTYGFHIRDYYGMSTERAQLETGKTNTVTPEGVETYVDILYSLEDWCTTFTSYLQSAMSYTNSFNLSEFKNSIYTITKR